MKTLTRRRLLSNDSVLFPAPLLVGGLVFGGCETAPPPGVSFEVTDSSGLFVATNVGDPALGFGSIQVDSEPLVSLGVVTGDSVYQFSRIRGGTRLADGRLAIVDGASRQVRIFDESGAFIRSFGGRGQGPGEFQQPTLAGRVGDTLVLHDSDNRRVTWLDPSEGVIREIALDEESGGFFQTQGMFGDGSVVAGGGFSFSAGSGETLSTGLRRSPTGFVRLGALGEVATDFGQFPGLEMYFEVEGPRVSARLIPFGRVTDSGVAPDRLYVGTANAPQVEVFGRDGSPLGVIRWEASRSPVNAADRAAYLEESLVDADDEDERRRIQIVTRDYARDEFPPYQNLEADAQGNLWVNEYRRPGDDVPRFRVFDDTGRLIARVALPQRLQPLEIGDDYIVGRRLDEFDIEYVEVYRLVRR